MNTRYHCSIDGRGLQDIDPAICVTDIREEAPEARAVTASCLGDGQRVLRTDRACLRVSVVFEVHAYDPARRKAIALKACDWAREGWLTVSDRPGQRLRVRCERLPAVGSALRWTDPLTVTFAAWALPYWQEARPAAAAFTGVSGSATLSPGGTQPCCLEAEVTARKPVTSLTLTAGGRAIRLTGLGMKAGETLSIGYDGERRQFMRVGDRSVLARRSADSADDLTLEPRKPNTVGIEADGEVSAVVRGYGLWR